MGKPREELAQAEQGIKDLNVLLDIKGGRVGDGWMSLELREEVRG